MVMKIFDCFLFNNELELLDLRLNCLNDSVDYFVLTESYFTFSGNKKRLHYLENKNNFKKFNHKIIHNVVTDKPKNYSYNNDGGFFDIENYQRSEIKNGLINVANDNDLVLISDIDEIPEIDKLFNLIDYNKINVLTFLQFYYYINLVQNYMMKGTVAVKYEILKELNFNDVFKVIDIDTNNLNTISDCGHHYSFMYGVDRIKQKIKDYSHQEFNNEYILDHIEYNINNNKDIFFRDSKMKVIDVSLENSYNKWIVNNKNLLKSIIK